METSDAPSDENTSQTQGTSTEAGSQTSTLARYMYGIIVSLSNRSVDLTYGRFYILTLCM